MHPHTKTKNSESFTKNNTKMEFSSGRKLTLDENQEKHEDITSNG